MTDPVPETEGETADENEVYTPWSHDQDAFEPTVIRRVLGADGLPEVVDDTQFDEALAPPYSPSTFVCMRDESVWYAMPTKEGTLEIPADQTTIVAARRQGRAGVQPRRVTPEPGQIIGVYTGNREALECYGLGADGRPVYYASADQIDWHLPFWPGEEPGERVKYTLIPGTRVRVVPKRWECRHLVEKLYPLSPSERMQGMTHGHTQRFCSAETSLKGSWLTLTNGSILGCTLRTPYDVASSELLNKGNRMLAAVSGENRQYHSMFKLAEAPANPKDEEGLSAWLRERTEREKLGEPVPPLPEGIEAPANPDVAPAPEAPAATTERGLLRYAVLRDYASENLVRYFVDHMPVTRILAVPGDGLLRLIVVTPEPDALPEHPSLEIAADLDLLSVRPEDFDGWKKLPPGDPGLPLFFIGDNAVGDLDVLYYRGPEPPVETLDTAVRFGFDAQLSPPPVADVDPKETARVEAESEARFQAETPANPDAPHASKESEDQ